MNSTFTWLDYSEHDKRKMIDVISSFSERDTVDELGIGSIRDGFANIFFPGTGTVQTRARYFLFIPWMYRSLEYRRVSSYDIGRKSRQWEIRLIDALEKNSDHKGNIGRDARANLQRLPSHIYWLGLQIWGIRIYSGSQAQYHRYLDHWYRIQEEPSTGDDTDVVVQAAKPNWDFELPEPPKGFPQQASFRLTRAESRYLKARIQTSLPDTLLAYLVNDERVPEEVDFCWDYSRCDRYPTTIREQVSHAKLFSETIHGAALLYNLMLAEASKDNNLIDDYFTKISDWGDSIEDRRSVIRRWDRSRFWAILNQYSQIPSATYQFVEDWLSLLLTTHPVRRLAKKRDARRLIHDREQFLKGALARLSNPQALDLWTGASGIGRLDYRWRVNRQIISDIVRGLQHA